ncbi:MAG: energy-coupling factor transporter ATPase [Eubacteriales bacterium]|nr:energy-coupling factor transporter ATPase [Eubacteriales bacterium]
MAHFEIKDLTFSYPAAGEKKALDQVNITIEHGQYVTVCGQSGSGKTTLLKQLKSVLAPHGKKSGEILFEGTRLEEVNLRTQSSKIGYVMQNPDSQIVTDKVWHELAFGLESLGMDQKTMRLRVAEMASYFGIQDWFHRNVTELSGGQKQLLNLASIMAMQPSVLILDEPTSQLDPIAAADFLNTIRKINRELRTTIIITEHRLEDIFYASDKVIVMEEGRVIADEEPGKIGAFLKKENRRMFAAMPSPVQIFYGVNGTGNCPLTVREGGAWLSRYFAGKTPEYTTVEDKITIDPDDVQKPAVLMKEVWFRYEKNGKDVLKGTTIQVPENTLFAIVGGNGTGKSTSLKIICNICKPYRGHVYIHGQRVDKIKGDRLFKQNVALLPQDPLSLFVKKTVREDLEEMCDRNLSEEKVREIAKLCEIEEILEQHPYDLSGGEQQRAALAKILLTEPKILLLDEPTKGLDNFFKIQFGKIMKRLKQQGATIIMVSHDVEFCAKYADLVSMFFDGGIITTNTANRFFAQNSFYTTAANRMSRHVFENAVTNEDVIQLCQKNQ